MPQNVNGVVDPRYTAHLQYSQFVDFADRMKATPDAFAQSNGSILVGAKAKRDFVGNVFRGHESRTMNDEVRGKFKSAIMGMFGVADEKLLPDSVKEAMKLEDYGKGKPLTARRISAVQSTVDRYFADVAKPIMDKARTIVDVAMPMVPAGGKPWTDEEKAKELQKRVMVVVNACVDDPDVREVATANIKDVLVDFTSAGKDHLSPPNRVRAKVDAIAANFHELREFAKGDQAVLAAGRIFTHVHPRDFSAMMSAAMEGRTQLEANLENLLHPKSAKELDAGVHAFTKALDGAMAKCTRALGGFKDAVEEAKCRTLMVRMLLHRDDAPASMYDDLFNMLTSGAAGELKAVYRDLSEDLRSKPAVSTAATTAPNMQPKDGPSLSGLPRGLKLCMADFADARSAGLDLLKDSVATFFDGPGATAKPISVPKGDTRRKDVYREVGRALEENGREAMRAERESVLHDSVKGTGTGADMMRHVFARKIDRSGAYKPAEAVNGMCKEAVKRMIGQTIVAGVRNLHTAWGMASYSENCRGFVVKLPDGTELSANFNRARDQIASLLTKGAKGKFTELSPREKNKAYIVMSLVTQKSAQVAYKGPALALNPECDLGAGPLDEGSTKPAFIVDDFGKVERHTQTLRLDLDDDGGLKLSFDGSMTMGRLRVLKDDGETYAEISVEAKKHEGFSMEFGDVYSTSSSLRVGYELKIGAEAFNRMGDAKPEELRLGGSDIVCEDFHMNSAIVDGK